ncbi:MAG: hypothetical protein ACC700_12085 [Anaerolineales bacterium]
MTLGIDVEVHHGEVASAGQQEIDLKYAPLLQAADQRQWYKYILKNVVVAYGKTVTFMPKPTFEDNGSGMHCHQSLWKGDSNIFYRAEGYSGLSQEALWYIGGIIQHTPSTLGPPRVRRRSVLAFPPAGLGERVQTHIPEFVGWTIVVGR